MKAIINEAIRQNIIKDNPFSNYKVATEKTQKIYLTIDELQKLQYIYDEAEINSKLKNVLQYFLFCCYTGLRYTDILNMTYDNIVNDNLEFTIHKTNDFILIPLSKKAKILLPGKPSEKLFSVLTNQKTNEYLKLIMIHANINKNISFHSARHTFATTAITLGIPIEVVSKLLGHNEIKTTQIYAKIINSVKTSEIKKFDEM